MNKHLYITDPKHDYSPIEMEIIRTSFDVIWDDASGNFGDLDGLSLEELCRAIEVANLSLSMK